MDQLQAEMSNEEYVRWGIWYAREAQRKQLEHLKMQRK